ncbi:MAG: T9SS type A sorting domain-containing protein, partial [Candidatus Aegiribacteria sp.]|nr:T9SS type A sorting domain-containing protein [Candidatus Aegiribacteria sp.]
ESGPVTVSIYDLAGRLRALPVDGEMDPGTHEVEVSGLPSGSYYVRLTAGNDIVRRVFTLIHP